MQNLKFYLISPLFFLSYFYLHLSVCAPQIELISNESIKAINLFYLLFLTRFIQLPSLLISAYNILFLNKLFSHSCNFILLCNISSLVRDICFKKFFRSISFLFYSLSLSLCKNIFTATMFYSQNFHNLFSKSIAFILLWLLFRYAYILSTRFIWQTFLFCIHLSQLLVGEIAIIKQSNIKRFLILIQS